MHSIKGAKQEYTTYFSYQNEGAYESDDERGHIKR